MKGEVRSSNRLKIGMGNGEMEKKMGDVILEMGTLNGDVRVCRKEKNDEIEGKILRS